MTKQVIFIWIVIPDFHQSSSMFIFRLVWNSKGGKNLKHIQSICGNTYTKQTWSKKWEVISYFNAPEGKNFVSLGFHKILEEFLLLVFLNICIYWTRLFRQPVNNSMARSSKLSGSTVRCSSLHSICSLSAGSLLSKIPWTLRGWLPLYFSHKST